MAPEPNGNSRNHKGQSWLRRQIQRLRGLFTRDVNIVHIGDDARNIVIGSRNVQINIGDRNLTLPVLSIPLLLLVIVSFLVFPLVEPMWNPAQMSGQFRIAVAQFGETGSDGRASATENGRVLSQWLFDGLFQEYQSADTQMADAIEIWHDSRTDTAQNFKFGIMEGHTAQARQASAARLADRIGAHMVIYGNLVTDNGSSGLDLEFYLSPLVNDETASIVGSHRLGTPVPLPVPFDTDRPETNIVVSERLQVRTDALFWLTVGLTQQFLGRAEQALETFRHAEAELADWSPDDGKEILYFFTGREELFLGQSEKAEASFRQALEIDPNYARAQVGLGSSFLQRARAVEPKARLEEPKYLEQALDAHRRGLELALMAEDRLVEAVARIQLAKSYRLLGETHYFLDAYDEADRLFNGVISEVDLVVPLLADTQQYRLLAQAYEAQGAAYLQQGDILRRQQELEASQARFELAQVAYQKCIDQGDSAFFDEILRDKVIEQGCQRYQEIAHGFLEKSKGEQP